MTDKWQPQEKQTGISVCNCSIRLVNEGFKGRSYRKNTLSELKAAARNDHRPPWHKLKDDDATDAQLQQWRRDPA